MPELPEVETVARAIRPRLEGRRIVNVAVNWSNSVGDPRAFRRHVIGATVTRVRRRAKYIVFELGDAGCLVGHLRMSGRMQVGERPGKYVVVSLELDDGNAWHFIDVRKFGRLLWAKNPHDIFPPLGPEPLGPEFTAAWLAAALRSRKRQLKPLLLDQSFVAGLGNIYVDEALFEARLHPLRAAHTLRRPNSDRLHDAIREILASAIQHEGSTFDRFYRTPEGQPGSYQHKFRIYGRTGEPCRRCGAKVRKLVVGSRGTHICPRCQRAPAILRT